MPPRPQPPTAAFFFAGPLANTLSILRLFIDNDSQLKYPSEHARRRRPSPLLCLVLKGYAVTADEIEQLRQEHLALMLSYCEVQQRCSAQIQSLTRQVETLSQQLIRSRAQLIARDSALAWERELRQTLVMQQLIAWQSAPPAQALQPSPLLRSHAMQPHALGDEQQAQQLLENSLQAADLVICQTGCISDGAFWRVQDHCKRTGKPCVLLDASSNALHVVQLHSGLEDSPYHPGVNPKEIA